MSAPYVPEFVRKQRQKERKRAHKALEKLKAQREETLKLGPESPGRSKVKSVRTVAKKWNDDTHTTQTFDPRVKRVDIFRPEKRIPPKGSGNLRSSMDSTGTHMSVTDRTANAKTAVATAISTILDYNNPLANGDGLDKEERIKQYMHEIEVLKASRVGEMRDEATSPVDQRTGRTYERVHTHGKHTVISGTDHAHTLVRPERISAHNIKQIATEDLMPNSQIIEDENYPNAVYREHHKSPTSATTVGMRSPRNSNTSFKAGEISFRLIEDDEEERNRTINQSFSVLDDGGYSPRELKPRDISYAISTLNRPETEKKINQAEKSLLRETSIENIETWKQEIQREETEQKRGKGYKAPIPTSSLEYAQNYLPDPAIMSNGQVQDQLLEKLQTIYNCHQETIKFLKEKNKEEKEQHARDMAGFANTMQGTYSEKMAITKDSALNATLLPSSGGQQRVPLSYSKTTWMQDTTSRGPFQQTVISVSKNGAEFTSGQPSAPSEVLAGQTFKYVSTNAFLEPYNAPHILSTHETARMALGEQNANSFYSNSTQFAPSHTGLSIDLGDTTMSDEEKGAPIKSEDLYEASMREKRRQDIAKLGYKKFSTSPDFVKRTEEYVKALKFSNQMRYAPFTARGIDFRNFLTRMTDMVTNQCIDDVALEIEKAFDTETGALVDKL